MLVVRLITTFGILAAAFVLVRRFNHAAQARFGYRFFSRGKFFAIGAAALLFFGAYKWQTLPVLTSDDLLSISALVVTGLAVLGLLAHQNVRRTDWKFGLTGTALQFGLFPLVAELGIFAIVLWALCLLIVSGAARPVYVINQH